MSHDKIKDAARRRMTRTGESYTAARRAVIGEHRTPAPRWFEISYSRAGIDKITAWLDTALGRGPGESGLEIGADAIRVRMGEFRQDIPRGLVRSAARSYKNVHGTTGVHLSRGRLLVNGATDNLVELKLDPPCLSSRSLATLFFRQRVDRLVVSLVDPDGFLAALETDR